MRASTEATWQPANIAAVIAEEIRVDGKLGVATMSRPARGVVLVRYEGMAHAHFVPRITAEVDTVIAEDGGLLLFVDAEHMSSYDSGYRVGWTEWLRRNRSHVELVHILFTSSLVRMGINIVNPLVGGYLVAHSSRAQFYGALEQATSSRSRAS